MTLPVSPHPEPASLVVTPPSPPRAVDGSDVEERLASLMERRAEPPDEAADRATVAVGSDSRADPSRSGSEPASATIPSGPKHAERILATGDSRLAASGIDDAGATGPFPHRAGGPEGLVREAAAAIADQQQRLDAAIELAREGRTFSPQELLALQADAHRFSHDLNLASKAVEQVSSGMKKVLETQI